jgi:hypothetical protein
MLRVSLSMRGPFSQLRSGRTRHVVSRQVPAGMVLAVAACITAACNDPTGFGAGRSTYVARTVNGAPVPSPLLQNANYELLLIADTIRFGLFGEAEWMQVRRTTVAGVAREVEVTEVEYFYRVRGDSVLFFFACPPDADCLPPPRGVFSSDRRNLVVELEVPNAVLAYERTNP